MIFADEQPRRPLWKHTVDLGVAADPFAAWLTLRGLKTLALRMERHCANAAHLSGKLAAHPAVTQVHWPGLPDHPDHATAQRILSGFGGMVAFDLGDVGLARRLVERVRVFQLAESLGGVESLIGHPASMTHASVPPALREKMGLTDSLVRLSVGIEDVDDLIADLEQAMDGTAERRKVGK